MKEFNNLPGDSALIFAPHNDDEILGTGGAIQRYVESGREVHVAIITNGDGQIRRPRRLPLFKPDFVKLGYRRQSESREALEYLGVPSERTYFLGYPDRGLNELWTEHWGRDNLYFSPFTKTDKSPYESGYSPGAPYCGVSALADVKRLIREVSPDVIFTPHPNDRHQDHWGTNGFAVYALEELKNEDKQRFGNVKTLNYLVHGLNYPSPRGEYLMASLTRPGALAPLDTDWILFPLGFNERLRKLRAIGKYRSQTQIMRKYLVSFARANELFGVVPELDLSLTSDADNPFRLSLDAIIEEEKEDRFLSYLDPKGKSRLASLKRYPDLKSVSLRKNNGNLDVLIEFFNVCGLSNEIKVIIKTVVDEDREDRPTPSYTFLSKGDDLYLNGRVVSGAGTYRDSRDKKSYLLSIPLTELKEPKKLLFSITLGRNGITFARSASRVVGLR